MSIVLGVAAVAALMFALGVLALKASPAALAGAIRLAGPLAVGTVGGVMMLLGRAAVGGMLVSLALGWYARNRAVKPLNHRASKRSTVRTDVLEMELDHGSGELEGRVLTGQHAGRMLSELSEGDIVALREALLDDGESVALLDTYLDGRFPAWRENAEPDADGRKSGPTRTGPMGKEEAYKVLGLEAGASAADIRQAHRRLMQRLHPDLGGTTYLAARINEAKEVLLAGSA